MTTGLVFGKFAPLTTGHIDFILRAAARVDTLYVFLSFDQKFQKTLSPYLQDVLSLRNRHLSIMETFKGFRNIHIDYVDESEIAAYPEGCKDYELLIRAKTSEGVSYTHAFSSEPAYQEYFDVYFPEVEHVIIDADRKVVPISATMVRSDINTHWDRIAPAMKKFFAKKVAIVGVESTGKSTLAKALALHYNTNYVEEIGRTICEEEYGFTEQYMDEEHYEYVAMVHKIKEAEALKTANRVLISDTNNLITCFSALCSGKGLSKLLLEMSKKERYDLVICLDPDVKWVYDPLRTNDTPEKRKKTDLQLKSMLSPCNGINKNPTIYINGDYQQRKDLAINAINSILNNWEITK